MKSKNLAFSQVLRIGTRIHEQVKIVYILYIYYASIIKIHIINVQITSNKLQLTDMKKQNISQLFVVGIVVVLLLTIYSLGYFNKQNLIPKNADDISKDSIISESKSTSTSISSNLDQKDIIKNTEEKYKILFLGANVTTQDNISFSIKISDLGKFISNLNAEWGLSSDLSYYPKNLSTTGKFVHVYLTLNNNSNQTINLKDLSYGYLIDQDGREFHWNPIYYGKDQSSLCRSKGFGSVTLKPGIPCVMNILFETSELSNSYNFKLYYTNY